MKCPRCNKRLWTREERKYKHCLSCGYDFSLIEGKIEFTNENYKEIYNLFRELKMADNLKRHISYSKEERLTEYLKRKVEIIVKLLELIDNVNDPENKLLFLKELLKY